MLYKNIIIDGNNLYEKNFYKFKYLTIKLSNTVTIVTGGIYGFIRSINRIEKKYLSRNGKIYILFDNVNSKVEQRKNIDPEYKANRIKKNSLFYKSLSILQYLLINYKDNLILMYKTSYEADDLVKPIISIIDKSETILLVSEDQDWARLINYRDRIIHWFAKKSIFTPKEYYNKYHYLPSENTITLYKTIRGDVSDNIPIGVSNILEKDLLRLISEYKDIYDLLLNINNIEYLSDIIKENFISNQARLRLNYQLISFQEINIKDLTSFIYYTKFNSKILKIIYNDLKFNINLIDSRFDGMEEEDNSSFDFFKMKKLNR